MTLSGEIVYLGLGANLGDRERNIGDAISRLRTRVEIEKVSSLYETAPVGYVDQPDFLNAACSGRTRLAPDDLLSFCKGIEAALGRQGSFRNAPRQIDIDILLYGEQVISTPELTIPHPRMAGRSFVLAPLVEIAAQVRHPVLGKTVWELLEEVGTQGVRPFAKGVET